MMHTATFEIQISKFQGNFPHTFETMRILMRQLAMYRADLVTVYAVITICYGT